MRLRSDRGQGSPDGEETPLSLRIRTATSSAHRGLEARTGWPATLVAACDVATMLQMFRALHASLDAARASFALRFQQHGFAPGPGSATATIDDDLRTLGIDGAPGFRDFAPCPNFDAALGLHYVASGSAMGNMLLLRHVAAHLDPSIAAASRFLRLSSSGALSEFRSFRAALDAYGDGEPARGSAVIEGADAAFRACVAWLDTND